MQRRIPIRYQTPGVERVSSAWVSRRLAHFEQWAAEQNLYPDGPGAFAGRLANLDVRVRTTLVRDCAGPVRLSVAHGAELPVPATPESHGAIWDPLFADHDIVCVERDEDGYTLVLAWSTEPADLPPLLGFFTDLPRGEAYGYRDSAVARR